MTWTEAHRRSEFFAASAAAMRRHGKYEQAQRDYERAAEHEEKALIEVTPNKPRTYGIIAVSAVSLWFKAERYQAAERLAHQVLASSGLIEFAAEQLRELLQSIWIECAKRNAGVTFLPGQVTVSIKGGQIVTGGAPLELIINKIQTIQSIFYRTIENIKGLPFRTRGAPIQEIQDACRPWLFQAPPGSYQFSVAVQEPAQADFFAAPLSPGLVANRFLEILKASADDDNKILDDIVPNKDYRSAFLKLSRNLSPTGKAYGQLSISSALTGDNVTLLPATRDIIKEKLQKAPSDTSQVRQEVVIRGILRAVHLDKDWLEVLEDGKLRKIWGLEETIDDLIGPMINRSVVVKARFTPQRKPRFLDIELDE